MNKTLSLFLLAVGVSGTAFSQKIPDRRDPPPPPPPHHRPHERGGDRPLPLKELNLTDGQREAFRQQRETFKQKMDALKKEENITVKEWKARMAALRKENQTVMQKILTPEQKDKLKQMRKERGDSTMMRMKQRLGLSDDQMEQMKKQRAATQKQMRIIRENKDLSETDKKEAIKKLMQEQKESFDKLLTPEQKAKRKEMRKPGRERRPGMPPPPPPSARPPKQKT